ncbi:hypothetical protein M5E87_26580 [Flavonifractor plautii]|nr:hypothetical protein M5E87_26580 [Flavonifractor plautii]
MRKIPAALLSLALTASLTARWPRPPEPEALCRSWTATGASPPSSAGTPTAL